MPERRPGDKDAEVREEVSQRGRRDPRRDSIQMPGTSGSIVAEMQSEIAALRKRVQELEEEAASERARRIEAEEAFHASRQTSGRRASDPPMAKPTKQLRAVSRRPAPMEDALASKATRQLRIPSRRPPSLSDKKK